MTQQQRDANNYASLLGQPLPYNADGSPAGGGQNAGNQSQLAQGLAQNGPGAGFDPIATAAASNQSAPANAQTAAGPSVGEANQLNDQPTQTMSQGVNSVSGSTGDQFFLGGNDQSGFDPSMLPSNAGNQANYGGSGTMSTGGGGGLFSGQAASNANSYGQMTNPSQSATGGQGGQSGGSSPFGQIGATNGGTGIFGNGGQTTITPKSSGINTSGAASAYIADTNAAYKAAQQANTAMYNTVNGEYNQDKADLSGGYAQMLGLTSNLGASETAQNQQLTQQQTSDATQRAISQGLGNTSVLSGMQQGAQNQGQIRQLGINNQVANQQLGVLNTSISGMQNNALAQQNFQERVSNPYPNTSGYLQAIQMGGSGSGGFYGQK
jgi:hypothetical protein